ncbi:MAG: valine--tRNA ligase [Candidatus Nanoarchaeia archaeon]
MDEYNFKTLEKKWQNYWEKEHIYQFDPHSKKKSYSVDTPPPTVSGKMHIGHAFSYSQQDYFIRYHRMKGENIFYPFGTDDNGLPTERLVEKLKNVKSTKMDRQAFIQLCNTTLKEIVPDFIQGWKNIGISCDWTTLYSTINPYSIKTSQASFLDLHKKDLVYQQEAPVIWCVQCQTAIAQAELEDAELDSTFNDVQFGLNNGEKITIATTRPELLAACVMVFVHPQDKRYNRLIGKQAIVPLFNQEVPIYADESVEIEKGTGILMVCSYGDKKDVEAIKKRKIAPRIIFTRDGKLNEFGQAFSGLTIKEARKAILEKLEQEKLLVAKKQIKHTVNVHERCKTEIEFLATKQWFIKVLENKETFLEAGKKINWYPEFMRTRYENWVKGLEWDWCISRQRHFGVSFPVWHCKKCTSIVVADKKQLPVDPLKDNPLKKCKCGSNEFEPETDVMDTWATSSVTPQIALNWVDNETHFKKMYPMSLRVQAHDIISTWATYTIIKGIYHHKKIPWKNIVISGHMLDSHGRKMSKSLGNVIEPQVVLDKYGADAWRYLAAGSKLGENIPYQEKDLQTGKRTITKLWNAAKFCAIHLENYKPKKVELEPFDKWILTKLNTLIKNATTSFENYEYSKVRAETDEFFWKVLCDNYLEIVKDRLYNPDRRGQQAKESAQYTLYHSLLTVVKLFAPIMPHVTEEIYHELFKEGKSIHLSTWPEQHHEWNDKKLEKIGDKAIEIISLVRQEKTKSQKSLKEPVKNLTLPNALKVIEQDLKAVSQAQTIKYGKQLSIEL